MSKGFWKSLASVGDGDNTLGDITLQGYVLQSQLFDYNIRGKILVKATPFLYGHGHQLNRVDREEEDCAKVYWLPWQDMMVTVAARAEYEYSDCSFFMTSGLTGCRFSITDDMVLHVANSNANSAYRTSLEEAQTGPRAATTRRLSITNHQVQNNFCYSDTNGIPHRTLVFGIKQHNGVWLYKAFNTYPPPGTWKTI